MANLFMDLPVQGYSLVKTFTTVVGSHGITVWHSNSRISSAFQIPKSWESYSHVSISQNVNIVLKHIRNDYTLSERCFVSLLKKMTGLFALADVEIYMKKPHSRPKSSDVFRWVCLWVFERQSRSETFWQAIAWDPLAATQILWQSLSPLSTHTNYENIQTTFY